MKGCLGCLGVLLLIGAVIQAVTFLWVSYWPAIIGLTLSWLVMRHYHVLNKERD